MSSFLRHRVTAADTLRGLALRYLGDHDQWPHIAAFNNLDPSQYELVGIKELLIPVEIGQGGDLTDSPYLTDMLVSDGGLVLNPQGDVGAISGVNNVLMAIIRALSTDKGAMVQHPEYGLDLDRFVGAAGHPRMFLRLLKVEVERVIRRDPRVQDVKNLRVVQQPGIRRVEIGARITLIGGRDTFELLTSRNL